jgi:adenine-specific DNA methylase
MSEPAAVAPLSAKALGAYYTDEVVAEFLVRWAVRSASDRVLDPSFGGGVFLKAAAKRLAGLDGEPRRQVFGIELDSEAHATAVRQVGRAVSPQNLIRADFFDVTHEADLSVAEVRLPRMDVVVGNPPYIRYQRFAGDARMNGLGRAERQGVSLPRLASSWAPFVVHSAAMLADGGRLALVLPTELTYATYAQPVVQFLRRSFASVTLLTFRKKLFPHLSESTLLLLADNRGDHGGATVLHRDFMEIAELVDLSGDNGHHAETRELTNPNQGFVSNYISREARDLYFELCRSAQTFTLGSVADVGIGYVTGGNDFFHPDDDAIGKYGIPTRFLRKAVRRGRPFQGLALTPADWEAGRLAGDTGYLLLIRPDDVLPEGLCAYLAEGEAAGIAGRYKCRKRTPWYAVPNVYSADMFVTYMNGQSPRLVVNEADAVAPNTLHVVRFRRSGHPLSLAAAWRTSLSRLSCEIEGRTLGGGMLKLEPTEAQRVRIPSYPVPPDVCALLDETLRTEGESAAQRQADAMILRQLGLTERECVLLAEAASTLRERRYGRAFAGGR